MSKTGKSGNLSLYREISFLYDRGSFLREGSAKSARFLSSQERRN